jgi:hypoxanthine phosphoribosyltransferase
MPFGRKRLDPSAQRRLALDLLPRLRPFSPQAVVFIRRGGETAGRAIAEELGVPALPLDIRYPATRLIERAPGPLAIVLLAAKELLYRATRPSPGSHRAQDLPPPGTRVLLVDDSASSGRTVRVALQTLAGAGIDRRSVRVAVIRCGPRARGRVDHFAVAERLFFVRETSEPVPGSKTRQEARP